jgi:hypothetical protein
VVADIKSDNTYFFNIGIFGFDFQAYPLPEGFFPPHRNTGVSKAIVR